MRSSPRATRCFWRSTARRSRTDLLENQLFGHIRGAYTGADRDHAGLFVAAGTRDCLSRRDRRARSLDPGQAPAGDRKQGGLAGRGGSPGFVSGPDPDGDQQRPGGRSRRRAVSRDLFYRLNVVSIHLPPLRDRREDIPELVSILLAKHAKSLGKRVDGVDNATIRGLMSAAWIGNVRELDNALERAVILSEGPILTPDDFPAGLIALPDGRFIRRQPARGRSRVRAASYQQDFARLRRRQARGRAPAGDGIVVALPEARGAGSSADVNWKGRWVSMKTRACRELGRLARSRRRRRSSRHLQLHHQPFFAGRPQRVLAMDQLASTFFET